MVTAAVLASLPLPHPYVFHHLAIMGMRYISLWTEIVPQPGLRFLLPQPQRQSAPNPLDGAYFWKGERAEEISRRLATALRMAKADLLRSHEELRATLRLAGAEIRKLNFGRKDTLILKLLRRLLRESRAIAAMEKAR
jgi:hypothetical protein